MAEQAGWVDIIHTATGQTGHVIESTLPAWESAGWTRADNGSEGVVVQPQLPSPPPPPPSGDPNEE